MKLSSNFSLVVIAFVALFLGATQAVCAAPPANACSLLASAQVSATLGVATRPPAGPTRLDCIWVQAGAAAPGKGRGVMLTILGTLGPKLTPENRFNSAKKGGAGKGTPKSVSGVGDDAVYLTDSMGSTQLYVKKGAFVFKLRVVGFPAEQVEEKEKALALDVLAKL